MDRVRTYWWVIREQQQRPRVVVVVQRNCCWNCWLRSVAGREMQPSNHWPPTWRQQLRHCLRHRHRVLPSSDCGGDLNGGVSSLDLEQECQKRVKILEHDRKKRRKWLKREKCRKKKLSIYSRQNQDRHRIVVSSNLVQIQPRMRVRWRMSFRLE